jgi:hypothetical protein
MVGLHLTPAPPKKPVFSRTILPPGRLFLCTQTSEANMARSITKQTLKQTAERTALQTLRVRLWRW